MPIDPYRAPDSELLPTDATLLDTQPAPHGKRWLASLVDNLIVGVPGMILVFGFIALVASATGSAESSGFEALAAFLPQLVVVVGQVLYGSAFESSGWHATPGKRLLGLVVVREDGAFLTFRQALGRNAAKSVGLSICGLLAFSVLIDRVHRGLWDQVAGTRVVSRNPFAT